MSYVRWSDNSHVYIFQHVRGGIVCCGCILEDDEDQAPDFVVYSRTAMLDHVEAHRKVGQKVPEWVDDRLRREIAEQGDEVE